MGTVCDVVWECSNCGFRYEGKNGVVEVGPIDAQIIRTISTMYCPNCGKIKDITSSLPDIRNLGKFSKTDWEYWKKQDDSTCCENCQTKLEYLWNDKPNICPKCGKKEFTCIKEELSYWT